LQDIAKLLQDVRHQWFLTQTNISEDKHVRAASVLASYHEQVKAAYCDYAFWDLVPLFEFFCLARILPYMTELSEKNCVLAGLGRVYADLFADSPSLLSAGQSIDVHVASIDLSQPYHPPARGTTTVIVPALGPAMEAPYPGGQIKLLTLNV
jgi:hypothetical protein